MRRKLDLCEEAIKIAEVRHVCLYSGDIFPDFLYRRRQLCIAAPAYVDVRAFVHKLLRRRETDAAIAAGNQCNVSTPIRMGEIASTSAAGKL
jgi:hypothetical protein